MVVPFLGRDKEVQTVYKDNNFLTVPYLTVSPLDLKRDSAVKDIFKSEEKWLIGANEVFDANKQIEFVNNILRTDVKIKFTFVSILMKNFLVFCMIGVVFQSVKMVYNFLLNQWVWFSIAIIVYFVCTGGVVYSILQNMPLFKFAKNEYGQIYIEEYIMPGQRGQWAGEGYIASFLYTCVGLAYLYLARIQANNKNAKDMRYYIIVSLFTIFML